MAQPTDALKTTGRYFLVLAIAGFGIQHLLYSRIPAALGPPWTPVSPLLAFIVGVIFLAGSVSIAINKSARWAALLLAALFFLRASVAHVPMLFVNIHDPGPWTSGAEVLSMC